MIASPTLNIELDVFTWFASVANPQAIVNPDAPSPFARGASMKDM
jgi:hypothetical protein